MASLGWSRSTETLVSDHRDKVSIGGPIASTEGQLRLLTLWASENRCWTYEQHACVLQKQKSMWHACMCMCYQTTMEKIGIILIGGVPKLHI